MKTRLLENISFGLFMAAVYEMCFEVDVARAYLRSESGEMAAPKLHLCQRETPG